MQPLQCNLQAQLQETHRTTHTGTKILAKPIGGTNRVRNDRSRNRRTDEVPFIVACSHFTRKNTRFRALASSPNHHFPSSPIPFFTTSLPHHFPSSPLPFLTTSLPHHFPSSPLPFLTTSLPHHFPSSSRPFVTTSTSLLHHPSSPLPFIITSLLHHFPFSLTTLHHSQFFSDVLTHDVLLHRAPPFIIVNSFLMY